MSKLVLIRHGQSEWNLSNQFTGWVDVNLSEKGVEEAKKAGRLIKEHGLEFDQAYTSLLTRAIKTLHYALEESDQLWIPETKTWRLNERHYGALQGMNKDEATQQIGQKIVYHWRRSYRGISPPLPDAPASLHREARYRHVSLTDLPGGESLEMTQRRLLPYWHHVIVLRVASGETMLLVSHANTLRALTMFIEQIDENKVPDLHVLTGIPVLYEMNEKRAITARYSLE